MVWPRMRRTPHDNSIAIGNITDHFHQVAEANANASGHLDPI